MNNDTFLQDSVFTAVKIQVVVFWVVTSCSVVVGYTTVSDDLAASIFRVKYPTTTLHGITTQKISI
jgi:hypothetical protein